MRRVLVIIVIAALVAIGWAERDRLAAFVAAALGSAPAPTAPATVPPTTPAAEPAPAVLQRLVLLDSTGSTASSFHEAVQRMLADTTLAVVPAAPAALVDGVRASTGLHLVVHLVGSSPLQYGAPAATVDIPAVAALPPQPDLSSPGVLDPGGAYDRWKSLKATWVADHDAALSAALSGAAAIRALPTRTTGRSAITAGVASLALIAPKGDVAYLVASDLEENEPVQPADLGGNPVSVIQPDPTGSVRAWNDRFTRFGRWAKSSGAGAVTHSRPELAATVVRGFILGAAS